MAFLEHVKGAAARLGVIRGSITALAALVLGILSSADRVGSGVKSEGVRTALGLVMAWRFEVFLVVGIASIVVLTGLGPRDPVSILRLWGREWRRRRSWRRAAWIGGATLAAGFTAASAYELAWFWTGRQVRERNGAVYFVRAADSFIERGNRRTARFLLDSCRLSLNSGLCERWLERFDTWDSRLKPLERIRAEMPALSVGLPDVVLAIAEIRGSEQYLVEEVSKIGAELDAQERQITEACEAFRQSDGKNIKVLRDLSERLGGFSDLDRLTLEAEAGMRLDDSEAGFVAAVARDGCSKVARSVVASQKRSLERAAAHFAAQKESWVDWSSWWTQDPGQPLG